MAMFQSIAKTVLVASLLIGFTGAADAAKIVIKTPPPVVKVEVKPVKPFHKAVWIPGHWTWKRGKYVWVKGRWAKPHRGYVWVSGYWVKRPGGWVWIRGHWKRR